MKREQVLLEGMSTPQVNHFKRIVDREAQRRQHGGKPRKAGNSGQHRINVKEKK